MWVCPVCVYAVNVYVELMPVVGVLHLHWCIIRVTEGLEAQWWREKIKIFLYSHSLALTHLLK